MIDATNPQLRANCRKKSDRLECTMLVHVKMVLFDRVKNQWTNRPACFAAGKHGEAVREGGRREGGAQEEANDAHYAKFGHFRRSQHAPRRRRSFYMRAMFYTRTGTGSLGGSGGGEHTSGEQSCWGCFN